jgi:hypothetical protein
MKIIGIRAPITAAAVLQLIAELRHAKILNDEAVGRIKKAMAHVAFQEHPSHASESEFEAEIEKQLDRLFDNQNHDHHNFT